MQTLAMDVSGTNFTVQFKLVGREVTVTVQGLAGQRIRVVPKGRNPEFDIRQMAIEIIQAARKANSAT